MSTLDRAKIERDEGWRESIKKIPWLSFPASWEVQIIPPFSGAGVRFQVRRKGSSRSLSIYLDLVQALGYYGDEPYWEIYPYDGDTFRCDIDDGGGLMAAIKHAMKTIKKNL